LLRALLTQTPLPTPASPASTSRASLVFANGTAQVSGTPTVRVDFNTEGTKLFGDITKNNVGHEIAIFLDGALIEAPTVQEAITDGTAII
jgi:preprotein translocase subunit SecD